MKVDEDPPPAGNAGDEAYKIRLWEQVADYVPDYTADVTAALRTATIIVACHEASNPGSALWIELGIAYQRGLPACILFTTPIPHLPVPHLFYFHVSLPGIATTTTYTTTAQWIAHQLTLPPTPPALPPTTQTPTPP